jgi:hypothetical protein
LRGAPNDLAKMMAHQIQAILTPGMAVEKTCPRTGEAYCLTA